jgi:hypothetical protein
VARLSVLGGVLGRVNPKPLQEQRCFAVACGARSQG